MARSLMKSKGRREGGSYIALPHVVIDSENWRSLSPHAIKLFIDLYGQYRGHNNGDLCLAWSVMKPRGWRSKATLYKAMRELEHYGFILVTRQGGRKVPTLYAVTFQSIDACGGKLDVRTSPPPGTWRIPITGKPEKRSKGTGWGARKTICLPHGMGQVATPPVPLPASVSVH